jgi:hypothetical protein
VTSDKQTGKVEGNVVQGGRAAIQEGFTTEAQRGEAATRNVPWPSRSNSSGQVPAMNITGRRSCEEIRDKARVFRAEAQSRRGRKENKAVIYSESLRLSVSARVL